ncbi:MAG: recombinase family protein [Kiloniellaceae bacterium]
MIRVALYARYSSDAQSAASITDQFRLCRELAGREGWSVAGTYHDRAISGATVTLRPGIQALLQDAQRRQFEMVAAEALDRISRDQADVAMLFKQLQFLRIPIVTLAEGQITELHVGLKGTMNALFLKDLAAKTHRGLRGRVEQGKSGGGISYGYDTVRATGTDGEAERGGRTINESQAEIVRRVFREFASGRSPRAIAKRLNDEGLTGPSGKPWSDTTIRGHAKRGTGLVNNELYVGKLVWNRLRYLKDPATGKRVSRLNPPEDWITVEVPELRIVDDALWQAVKARQAQLAETYAKSIAATRAGHARTMRELRRPVTLLSGLIFCGCCGGSMIMRGQDRYACSTHTRTRTCANNRSITRAALETRVLAGLKDRLMAPEVAADAMRAYAEATNKENHERRAGLVAAQKELVEIERKIGDLVTLAENGQGTRTLVDRLLALEARQDELTALLATPPADIPDINPAVAGIYRLKVERLAKALTHPEARDEAAEALRDIIERITLTPGTARGAMQATLHGDLRTILEWTERRKHNGDKPLMSLSPEVVAGAGFEPATFRL